MTDKRIKELQTERSRMIFEAVTSNAKHGMALLWVTLEDEGENGDPRFGSAIMTDPLMIEMMKEEYGEEVGDALRADIQKVLKEAGEQVIRLIAEAAGAKDIEIETVEQEEE